MDEINREAKVGHGLQDERDEGHALGFGRYAGQSHFGGRTGHRARSLTDPHARSALMSDLVSSRPSPRVVRCLAISLPFYYAKWLSIVRHSITLTLVH
jgi:hypothetical protein